MPSKVSFVRPTEMIAFDGERCTPWVTTQTLSEHVHRYISVLDLVAGKRVLDISCGEGYGAAMMRREGAAHVTGADIDAEIIARAGRVYGTDGLEFVTADARAPLPFDDASFDAVISFETIEHFAEQEAFMDELARVLTPDGVLVISSPDATLSPPDIPNPFHVKELDEEEFLDLIRPHFENITAYRQGHVLGSVLTGPGEPTHNWRRDGFVDYLADEASHRRFIIAVASNTGAQALRTGMLHDGAIVASLNRRIRELEDKLKEFEASGENAPEGAK